MSKMDSHDPFGHLKHKLWPKKELGVKLAIWISTTKSQESTRFPCVHMACNILLQSFQRRLQLCFKPCFNRRFTCNVMGPQNCWSFGTKCHLDVGLVERHKVYYKGEGGGFSQIRAVVSLVSPSLPVGYLSTKSAPTLH